MDKQVKNYYAGAVAYADAAQIVASDPRSAGREALILPVHTLIGLALELGFKAVWLHSGGNEKEIRKPEIRHSLARLRDKCLSKGFRTAIVSINHIIDVIGENYAANDYRYMKPDSTIKFVFGLEPVIVVQKFLDEVAKNIGLPVRPEAKLP